MKILDREVYWPGRKWQLLPVAKVSLLQLPTDRNWEAPSNEIVKLANRFTSEDFPTANHFLPIMFQAKILNHLSKAKRKLNCRTVTANIFQSIEFSGIRNGCRSPGLASPVANIISAKLKEAAISGCAVGSCRHTSERVWGNTIIVQESLVHGLVGPVLSLAESLQKKKDNCHDSLRRRCTFRHPTQYGGRSFSR